MKKIIAMLLTLCLLFGTGLTVFAEDATYRAGFNPVVRLYDDGSFDYILYAKDMQNMTNGDLLVTYDPAHVTLTSVSECGNYTASSYGDRDGKVSLVFIYQDRNDSALVTLYSLHFTGDGTASYPTLTVTNLKGTFLKQVADVQVITGGEASTEKPSEETTDGETFMRGDVNEDGRITAADARLALRASASLEILSETQKKAADIDKDGSVTASDARAILRFTAGLQKF